MIIKGREDLGSLNHRDLADELLRQRAVLMAVSNNRAALQSEVRAYEQRFNCPSEGVHEAIDRGDIEETSEVTDWLIAYESLKGINTD